MAIAKGRGSLAESVLLLVEWGAASKRWYLFSVLSWGKRSRFEKENMALDLELLRGDLLLAWRVLLMASDFYILPNLITIYYFLN